MMIAVRDSPSLKMRKWPVRALEFTPLALTFIWALTLTLVPSTRAQPSKRDQEKDCREDQPCTPDFRVQFNTGEVLSCGEMVNQTVTREKPSLSWGNKEWMQKEVVILMMDPDAPPLTGCVYFLHWVASATLQADGTFVNIQNIVEYFPPSPPSGQVHRYQLLLYPRPDEEVKAKGGTNFDLGQFKKKYGLGAPLVSFQFRTGTQK